jgi:SPP1 gp7 family putative phage head morphogenesis protein
MCISCINDIKNSAEGERKYFLLFMPLLEEMLESYWTTTPAFHMPTIRTSFSRLLQVATEELGWGTPETMTGPHLARYTQMKESLAEFAVKKNHSFGQLAQALKSEGLDKAAFTAELTESHETYYKLWQQVEEQQVRVVSVSKKTQERIQEYGEALPYVTYNTLLDERVRESHKLLDQITLRYDHPFWQKNSPPNGYNCRCFITQDFEGEITVLTPEQEAFTPDKGFEKDFGASNDFFPSQHTFLQQDLSQDPEYQNTINELLNE